MCPAPHPDYQLLSDYATGKLPQDEASSVAQHLTECRECESTIQALEAKSDTLVSGLQVKPPAEPYVGETELRRAVANAAQIPAAGAKSQASQPAVQAEKVSTKGPVKLGPYQLLAKLGEGGMGAVFKARHEHLDKLVAIKVLPKKAMQDAAAVARFRREMKAVGALHHPNIVGAHDAGEQQGVHFLVMEYVEGRDLSSLLKKDGPVTVEQAISYMQQAAKGLAFAHGKGVIHRDIKPANLLVDGEGTLKILDMGLARLDDGSGANAEANQGLTQTGQVMGTVDYMAPEQAFDTHRADAKADVYSLGCTLYRILTGQNAFAGDTVVQKILAHREQPIPSLAKLRADAPVGLDALYQRMMAKKPEDRPAMAEVAKELEALQKGGRNREQGVEGIGPAIVVDVTKKGTGDRRQGTGAKLAAGLAPRSPAAAKPQASAEAGRGFRPPKKLVAAAAAGAFALIALGVWLVIRDDQNKIVAKIEAPPGTRVEVPPGGSVEVVGGPAATPAGTAVAAVNSPPPSFFTPTNTSAAPPPGGYALSFGDGATVEIPSLNEAFDPTGSLTVECWVTPYKDLFDKEVPLVGFQPEPFHLVISNSGNWDFRIFPRELLKEGADKKLTLAPAGPGVARRVYTGGFGDGEKRVRRHLAAVRTPTKMSLFLDGKLQSSRDLPAVTLSAGANYKSDFAIGGKSNDQAKTFFHGTFDEVRISQAARYEQDFTPPQELANEPGTLALYHFDEGAGDVLRDASGNKHDGKIVGATWVRADGSPIAEAVAAFIAPPPGDYALRFDDGQAVQVDSLTVASENFSVEAYVNIEELTDEERSVIRLGDYRLVVEKRSKSERPRWRFYVDGKTWSGTGSEIDPSFDKPVHVAVTKGKTQFNLYVDGKPVNGSGAPTADLPDHAQGLTLGGSRGIVLDQVRISGTRRYLTPDGKTETFIPAPRLQPDADTLALYHFDEGTGDILRDASGNKHDGKITAATWVRADGSAIAPPGDYALRFHPGSSYVDIPTLSRNDDGPMTIEAYVMSAGTATDETKYRKIVVVGGQFRCQLGQSNHDWSQDVGALNGSVVHTARSVAVDQKVHLAAVWDEKEAVLYVDGRARSRHTLNSAVQGPTPLGTLLGAVLNRQNSPARSASFDGVIDEVRISKSARYTQDFQPVPRFEADSDTLALYHFDEGTGDVLRDASGNKHDGQIVGATWVRADGSAILAPGGEPVLPAVVSTVPSAPVPPGGDYALWLNKNDVVQFPTLKLPPAAPLTIEAFVRLDEVPSTYQHLIGVAKQFNLNIAAQSRWSVQVHPTQDQPGFPVASPLTPEIRRRVAVAGVWTGTELNLYVDGNRVAATKTDNRSLAPPPGPFTLNSLCVAAFDELRVSNKARYTGDKYKVEWALHADQDTLAFYRFNEGSGDVVRDDSGHGHDGKIVGPRWKWIRANGQDIELTAEPWTLRRRFPTKDAYDTAALSPDGRQLLVGHGWNAELWDARSLERQHLLRGHTLGVAGVAFATDGKHVATTSRDQTVRVWRRDDGAPVVTLTSNAFFQTPSFSPTENLLVARNGHLTEPGEVRLWELVGSELRQVQSITDPQAVAAVDFLPDGKQLSVVMRDGSVRMYEPRTGRELRRWKAIGTIGLCGSVSPDGSRVAVGHLNGDIRLFDPANPNDVVAASLKLPQGSGLGPGSKLLWSADGRYLVAAYFTSNDEKNITGGVVVWDVAGKKVVSRLDETCVMDLAWADDGRALVTVSPYRFTAKVWNLPASLGGLPAPAGTPGGSPGAKTTNLPPRAVAPFDEAQAKRHQQAWAAYLGTQVETTNSVGATMVVIPPGEFLMGAVPKEQVWIEKETVDEVLKQAAFNNDRAYAQRYVDGNRSRMPQHSVTITKPFALGRTEVTVGQFKQFIAATGYVTSAEIEAQTNPKRTHLWRTPGFETADEFPVTHVSWHDAVTFCNWLSKAEGLPPVYQSDGQLNWTATPGPGYRLPTEAEWEMACRAGTTKIYHWGDDGNRVGDFAWYASNSGAPDAFAPDAFAPHPVATKLPNPYGLFDMVGLQHEWMQDWYAQDYFSKSPPVDPTGPITGTSRVYRSNEWKHHRERSSSSYRWFNKPGWCGHDNGFRLARSLEIPTTTSPVAVPSAHNTLADPAFQAWLKATQALPAAQKLEAVSKKLMELNPGFDGKFIGYATTIVDGVPKIDQGVVVDLGFTADHVENLAPLRALSGLKRLLCSGSARGKGRLVDLSPLAGLPLTNLVCYHTQVTDLSPLAGMPLKALDCHHTPVNDLSPLVGMALIDVRIDHTAVADLTPLKGMSVNILYCHNTPVSDLSPLAGIPLTSLNCSETQVSDLTPLKEMPLTIFWCHDAPALTDLTPLAGLPLKSFRFTPANIARGIDVVRGMKSMESVGVKHEVVGAYAPADFWKRYDSGEFGKPGAETSKTWDTPELQQWVKATQALPAAQQLEAVSKKLMELNPGFDGKLVGGEGSGKPQLENGVVVGVGFNTGAVTNIAPVRVFAGLQKLYARGGDKGTYGKLVDLSPLSGLPLTRFEAHWNPIVDLTPLRGMPLTWLGLTDTRVTDLSPLAGMRLESLPMNNVWKVRDISVLRGMPLKNLHMNGNQVTDLSPLAGMPLETLAFAGAPIADIAVLHGMPLTWIDLGHSKVTDLSPLHECRALTKILMMNHSIDPAKVAKLQEALPACKIEFTPAAGAPAASNPGVNGAWRQETDPERRVARWVLDRGGKVSVITKERTREIVQTADLPAEPFYVTSINRPSAEPPITADEWQSLGELRVVSHLDFMGRGVTDEALAAIGRCRSLQALVIPGNPLITDVGFGHLAALSRLEVLDAGDVSITQAGLKSIAKLTELHTLKLGRTAATLDATSLAPLVGLRRLRFLELTGAAVGDPAVAELAVLPQLKFFNLAGSKITDAAIDSLLKYPALRGVILNGNKLSRDALAKLAKHPTLTMASVFGCGLKPEQYLELARAAPTITYVHSDAAPAYADELAAIEWAKQTGTFSSGYHAPLLTPTASPVFDTNLVLDRTKVDVQPEDLRRLKPIKLLTSLSFQREGFTPEHVRIALEALRDHPTLNDLSVDGLSALPPGTLADLPRLTGLSTLRFQGSDLADDGFDVLPQLPQLQQLRLKSAAATDRLFDHFVRLTELRSLSLECPQMTGARLAELRALPKLVTLDLAKCNLTDDALKPLADLPELYRLTLDGTATTDAGLAHLAACRKLERLYVKKTKVTAAGVAQLRAALPECMIVSDFALDGPRGRTAEGHRSQD